MIKKILVAYDAGTQSQKALETAVELAKNLKAGISIVTSVNVTSYILSVGESALLREIEGRTLSYIGNMLGNAAERVKKEGIEVNAEILYEPPGEAIIKFAEKENVDLIVIGSHNRGVIDRVFMGSVSNYVVQNAHRPVLVIKE